MRHFPLLIVPALLGACSSAEEQPSPAASEAGGVLVGEAARQAEGRKVEVRNEELDFSYSYPAQAAAIPALKALLDADLEQQRRKTREGTLTEREEAKEGGWEPRTYAHATAWKVVTELPGWLSLSADRYEFTGGAHGNPWFDALLWDKAASVRRAPLDLFASKAALRDAIQPAVCDQIDRQRAEKRGEKVVRDNDDFFSACIDPTEAVIILGSSDRRHFDRVGVLVGPYLAGPYAEGDYEATVPVTQKVLAAVKPEFRQYFTVK